MDAFVPPALPVAALAFVLGFATRREFRGFLAGLLLACVIASLCILAYAEATSSPALPAGGLAGLSRGLAAIALPAKVALLLGCVPIAIGAAWLGGALSEWFRPVRPPSRRNSRPEDLAAPRSAPRVSSPALPSRRGRGCAS
ncbi:MAG: hypothetical protein HY720_15280 [Planctomycetes bacterium]|nr:hypothetical protein [Planctomycetota bacterium]